MDTFSKLTPPNAIRIRVEIFTNEETNEFAHTPRPRSSHITNIDTDNRHVDDNDKRERETALVSEQIIINTSKIGHKQICSANKQLLVDPAMTSYGVLYDLIAKAFDLKK